MATPLIAQTRRYAVLSAALAAVSAVLLTSELVLGMGFYMAPLAMLLCSAVLAVVVVVRILRDRGREQR